MKMKKNHDNALHKKFLRFMNLIVTFSSKFSLSDAAAKSIWKIESKAQEFLKV